MDESAEELDPLFGVLLQLLAELFFLLVDLALLFFERDGVP